MTPDIGTFIQGTAENLVEALVEEGMLHSGRDGGSVVDLETVEMLERFRQVGEYLVLLLDGSPLADELRAARHVLAEIGRYANDPEFSDAFVRGFVQEVTK